MVQTAEHQPAGGGIALKGGRKESGVNLGGKNAEGKAV
jgi:hypothetical protein